MLTSKQKTQTQKKITIKLWKFVKITKPQFSFQTKSFLFISILYYKVPLFQKSMKKRQICLSPFSAKQLSTWISFHFMHPPNTHNFISDTLLHYQLPMTTTIQEITLLVIVAFYYYLILIKWNKKKAMSVICGIMNTVSVRWVLIMTLLFYIITFLFFFFYFASNAE